MLPRFTTWFKSQPKSEEKIKLSDFLASNLPNNKNQIINPEEEKCTTNNNDSDKYEKSSIVYLLNNNLLRR